MISASHQPLVGALQPGARITLKDEFIEYDGSSMGMIYYHATINRMVARDTFSCYLERMSYDGENFFRILRTYTWAKLGSVVRVW